MKILVIDPDYCGLPFTLHAQDWGHEVKLWMPHLKGTQERSSIGKGLVDTVPQWEPYIHKADMVVVTDNSKYSAELEKYFEKGYPIFGANRRAAELELDRGKGIELLDRCGIKTLPYEVFTRYEDAIAFVKEKPQRYVSKPWGGNPDKSLSYVSSSAADMVFKLERWRKGGPLKGKLLLQKAIKGYEMAVGGWLSPRGWCSPINENWEEKRLMNDGLGVNTGEMGTVMRYTDASSSKLFRDVLEPCTEHLMALGYVGYVDMNCMVGEDGTPWPLEFTMRFGWPHFNLCMALHQGDPAKWMLDLLNGKDSMKVKPDVCVGVVMAHGDFPYGNFGPDKTHGFPLTGLPSMSKKSVWLSSVMECSAPVMSGGKVRMESSICTAGDYVLIATGLGSTVCEARESVYDTAWKINWPSNRMFRTDIGCRLEDHLKDLQQFGYAKGIKYE